MTFIQSMTGYGELCINSVQMTMTIIVKGGTRRKGHHISKLNTNRIEAYLHIF